MLVFCAAANLLSCKEKTSDSDIQTSFNEKSRSDGRFPNITATVNNAVVTLSGQCADEPCRTAAEQTASGLKGVKSVVNNITVTPVQAPVEISPDSALQKGVTDATKDFPGVKATVSDGEITLTGEIVKNRLPVLMQALHSLNPKKINNNLVIK